MAFLKTWRSQFIAWMVIYALGVALMGAKGGAEGSFFLWGLSLGVGAGIATSAVGPDGKLTRLGVVGIWLVACWIIGLALLWNVQGDDSNVGRRLEEMAIFTLIAGGPALLALLIWIFRRPKLT